jgi:hypothetical protein
MDDEKDDVQDDAQDEKEETTPPAPKHTHEGGDFAQGQEKEDHGADERRGTFATGESKEPGVPIDAKKGFFAEGEADEESEKNTRKGTFAEGESEAHEH